MTTLRVFCWLALEALLSFGLAERVAGITLGDEVSNSSLRVGMP